MFSQPAKIRADTYLGDRFLDQLSIRLGGSRERARVSCSAAKSRFRNGAPSVWWRAASPFSEASREGFERIPIVFFSKLR
jgi:hypothetical protein